MNFGTFIMYTALVAYIIYVTKESNFWGVSVGSNKAKADELKEKKRRKKVLRSSRLLRLGVWGSKSIGFQLSKSNELELKYRIDRLKIYLKYQERNIKPIELHGVLKLLQFVGFILTLFVYLTTHSIFSAVFLILMFSPNIFNIYADAKISDENDLLEEAFPDLYIVLYSRLIRGAHVRLAPTLKDYSSALKSSFIQSKSTKVMIYFIEVLRNNIEIYGDDSIAIAHIRDMYRSAMILNFCNLAIQALKGVDNSDKLLSFKIELNSKRLEEMERKADLLVKKGSRAVMLVYVIMFQFIALSWVAKLSLAGGLKGMLGL